MRASRTNGATDSVGMGDRSHGLAIVLLSILAMASLCVDFLRRLCADAVKG